MTYDYTLLDVLLLAAQQWIAIAVIVFLAAMISVAVDREIGQ